MARGERADLILVTRGLCDSREQAKRLIMAGEVMRGTERVAKASTLIGSEEELTVLQRPRYVGRGGLKLEGALKAFEIDPEGYVCLDLGASTGGFTDCLLQHGAKRVHAIDVGTNQLAWKLRNDSRVRVKEQFNGRYLTADDLGEQVNLVVMDLSFISLTKVLPAAMRVLQPSGEVICLIKPQFELSRDEVGKGGIVRDPDLREKAVSKIRGYVREGLKGVWVNCVESSITGMDGNVEYLARLRHSETASSDSPAL
ncbi:MAG: TlyA family rRNA (cytidine-2'-O)-methyltransferase [Roseibacillus sp.]|nr:TlyA family rRNA (cytidine-2'-O)-methyltransferase [Roseibacillus sp.]|tara:strand:+ start:4090 stop:4857 length:768 start_codon:yes stop_codon:yes gene_type:complete